MISLIKFLYRLLHNIGSFVIIQAPLQLAGIVVLPVICLVYDIGHLPYVLRWFDSVDPYINRDTSVITAVNNKGWLAKYNWLALRNPTNYFCYKHLGYQFTGDESYYIAGHMLVGDSTGDIPGFVMIELSTGIYEYRYVKRIGKTACFYFRLGHKIGNTNNPKDSYCQHVFTISYRAYSGQST